MIKDIYVSSCRPDGGIYHYKVEDNFRLVFADKTPLDRPMFIIRDGAEFYALLRTPFSDKNTSGLVKLKKDENGKLIPNPEILDSKGVVACHLCKWKGYVYAVNYLSGNIIRFPNLVKQHEGHSVNINRQESPHTHFVYPTPDNKYLFVCDLGIDKIITYDENLNKKSEASVPSGNGARHLAYSEDGKYVFCACELSSTISIFSYSDGILTFINDIPSISPETAKQCGNSCAAIRFYKNTLYISNRGHDSVSVFDVKGSELIPMAVFPCFGKTPRDMDIFDGNIIICNQDSNSTTILDANTGELKQTVNDVGQALSVIGM